MDVEKYARWNKLIITKVSVQKRPGRYNVFIDGKYAFSAGEKTLAEFVLLKGKELNDEQVEKIRQFDADAKASDLAAHFLSYEPRTIFEVLQYLKKHEISDEAANSAVSQLNELGYLDDRQYAKLFIKNDLRVGSDGPKSLLRKLTQKGVDPEISQDKLDEIDVKLTEISEMLEALEGNTPDSGEYTHSNIDTILKAICDEIGLNIADLITT